jgi:RimJ/RimL family protein N-acetyltransferase
MLSSWPTYPRPKPVDTGPARREHHRVPQATLHTARITLLPLSDAHLEYEVELDADPQVMRYLGNGRPRPRQDVVARHRERMATAARVPGLGFWSGFVTGRFVGWWLLEPVRAADGTPVPGEAELGYRLLPREWRKGFATEGALELLRHAFADLRLMRVIAQTMAVNTASRATMAAVGLRYVRTFHQQWDEPIAGAEHGEVEYATTRAEWLTRTGLIG